MLLPAVLMVVSGCATRDWVRDLMGKKEVEIGERMDGLGNQIKATEASLGETTQLARGAGERADGAMAKADGAMAKAGTVDSRLTRLWSNRYNQKAVDTVEVYFGFDQAELSDGAADRAPRRGQGAGGEPDARGQARRLHRPEGHEGL